MKKHFRLVAPLLAVALLFGTSACSSSESGEGSSAPQTSTAPSSAAPVSVEEQEKINLDGYPADDREALIWTVNKVIEASKLDAQNFNDRNASRIMEDGGPRAIIEFAEKEYPNTMSLAHPEIYDHSDGRTENQVWMSTSPIDFAQTFRDAEENTEIVFDPSHINYLSDDRVWLGEGSFKTMVNGTEQGFTAEPGVVYDPEFQYRYMFAKGADGKWKMTSSMVQNHILNGFWQMK